MALLFLLFTKTRGLIVVVEVVTVTLSVNLLNSVSVTSVVVVVGTLKLFSVGTATAGLDEFARQ